MSEEAEESVAADTGYLISGSKDTVGSSISLSLGESSVRIGESSVRIGEKFKTANVESSVRNDGKIEENKWWLKRPETRLGSSTVMKNSAPATSAKNNPTPDVTSSMKEFLEKEELCKVQHKNSGDINREKDDTLCDILASAAFDKYPSDFENATDEDIGSFLEEMSKIAGALSPSSAQERAKSGEDSNKNPSEEEKSVEELLEEAEKLVRVNVGLSKSSSRSETLINDASNVRDPNETGIVGLENDIFQLIEREVQRESEKIRKSPRNEKKKRADNDNGRVIIHENSISLRAPKFASLESQRRRFDEEKVEISSSSDLDDPIDRHSRSEDREGSVESRREKENLKKEITDVDKDFFDDLLRRSKEKIEGGMSGSSSFGQEDFSHFLRILQGQDRREQDIKDRRGGSIAAGIFTKIRRVDIVEASNDEAIVYPEREIIEILEKELPTGMSNERVKNTTNSSENVREFDESDSSLASIDANTKNRKKKYHSRNSSQERSKNHEVIAPPSANDEHRRALGREDIPSDHPNFIDNNCPKMEINEARMKTKAGETKKVLNTKGELYTIDLTPRLELFADDIPKLIAERTNENFRNDESPRKYHEDDKIGATMAARRDIDDARNVVKSCENLVSKETADIAKIEEKNISNREFAISEASNARTNVKSSPDRAKRNATMRKSGSETNRLAASRSYDRLSMPATNLRSSLDDVTGTKRTEQSRGIHPPQQQQQQPVKSSSVIAKYTKQQTKHVAVTRQAPKTRLSFRPSAMKFNPLPKSSSTGRPENSVKYCQAGGDNRKNFNKNDLEALLREERHRNSLLKRQIDSEAKLYKQQMRSMRASFEEELFAVKKQNIVLKAKIDELTLNEKRCGDSMIMPRHEPRYQTLERELEKQEAIINTYETENKRLVAAMEGLQEEIKCARLGQRGKVEANEAQRLNDEIKDLRENGLKLNDEITDLREKSSDAALRYDDAMQQNSLLKEELEMFKEQVRTKNEFINSRLQTITSSELESRRKIDDLRVDLSSRTEQLRNARLEYEKLEQAVSPLEKELLELRTREADLMEKLRISKSHVEREKQLTLKLKDQVILDNKKILDLNRQVREMERILKRKNPDSVSALILTAKSDHERINLEKIKLLEERIGSLEGEIRAKEEIGEVKLCDLQMKFGEMKEKYDARVMELEEKLLDSAARERKIFNDADTQTCAKIMENRSVDGANVRRDERERSALVQTEPRDDRKESKMPKIGPKSQNPKEDAHLIATIRGLKMEIANRDKGFAKMSKEYQELQKTNRRLQRERERLLNDRRNFKSSSDTEKNVRSASVCTEPPRLHGARTTETNDHNSNHCQNGNLSNGNGPRLSVSVPRLYDPLKYSENDDRTSVKKLTNENGILKEELNKINKDFMTLKNKRLHDLNLLQEEHEREIASLVKEYSAKFGDSKVVKLQGQINTQVAIITHLKQQIEKLRDYKEQVLVLKVEREHLENKVKILNEKVKYLSTPGTEQLQLLQDKITILQQRHESREMTLQALVRDLLRNRTQCGDCKGEKGKNSKQLCYFRQELDHILGMLQEISSVQ